MKHNQAATLNGRWPAVPDPPRRSQPLARIQRLRGHYLSVATRLST